MHPDRQKPFFPAAAALPLLGLVLAWAGCWTASGPEVVVYTALDSEFSEPVFAEFSKRTGVAVLRDLFTGP